MDYFVVVVKKYNVKNNTGNIHSTTLRGDNTDGRIGNDIPILLIIALVYNMYFTIDYFFLPTHIRYQSKYMLLL